MNEQFGVVVTTRFLMQNRKDEVHKKIIYKSFKLENPLVIKIYRDTIGNTPD